MHFHSALAERITPQKLTEAARYLWVWRSYPTKQYLGKVFHKKEYTKLTVKYKSPSNETQPKASLDLEPTKSQ